MKKQANKGSEDNAENNDKQHDSDIKTENMMNSDENADNEKAADRTSELEQKASDLNDKYLRLYSEFDNYRKRTMKEKMDIIKTAGEDILKSILPVIDDFERAIKANENVEDAEAIKQGIELIYQKLKSNVQLKGLTSFDSIGNDFDADTMEAITHIPAADDSQRGKVVDEIEKGYKLGDKVIRFAKVIVAQ
jgi:molecular chaperone GrpE